MSLAQIKFAKPINDLLTEERRALDTLKVDIHINFKKRGQGHKHCSH